VGRASLVAGLVTALLGLAIGVVPVLAFLFALLLLDSFQLVSMRSVGRSILWGMAAAGASYAANAFLLGRAGLGEEVVRRYVAPILEETLKAAYLIWLLRRGRVAFLIDAAIHGFAAGAGFALVENAYYAGTGASGTAVWVVRGLGTALMQGSTTAIVGIVAKSAIDRGSRSWARIAPALLLAIAIHSAYNHVLLDPLAATALVALALPLLMVVIFERSERALKAWLGEGLDKEVELLELIESGAFRRTHAGAYLESLRSRFPGPVVADMLCYLELYLQLALKAKGMLLARAAGIRLPVDPAVRAAFAEMKFLERSIGVTGRVALHPLRRGSERDLWQLAVVAESASPRESASRRG